MLIGVRRRGPTSKVQAPTTTMKKTIRTMETPIHTNLTAKPKSEETMSLLQTSWTRYRVVSQARQLLTLDPAAAIGSYGGRSLRQRKTCRKHEFCTPHVTSTLSRTKDKLKTGHRLPPTRIHTIALLKEGKIVDAGTWWPTGTSLQPHHRFLN